MFLTPDFSDDGELRLYATRTSSVVAYFTEDGEGGSVMRLEPGWLAYPEHILTAAYMGVRSAVLEEVSKRLSCEAHEVERHTFGQLMAIADPLPKMQHHWYGRSRQPKRAPRAGR